MFESDEPGGGEPRDLDDESLTRRMVEVLARMERIQAEVLALVGEWDARGLWSPDGYASAGRWLAACAEFSTADARALASAARSIHRTEVVKDALAAGVLHVGQAKALARARIPRTVEVFDEQEADLVEVFAELSVDNSIRAANRWMQMADTDGTPPDDDYQQATLSTGWEGRVRFTADLNADDGAIFANQLYDIMDELYRSHTAAGMAPMMSELRAEALVEMARRASAARDHQHPGRPLIIVTVNLDDLVGRQGRPGPATTPDGTIIGGDTLRRWLCDADLARVVVNGASEVLDVGRSQRTATPAQRRALMVRDRGCVFPGCDRPPGWCQAHHIVWWEHLGPTDLSNMCLLCSKHHHLIHSGRFRVSRWADGTLRFTRADGSILHDSVGHDGQGLFGPGWWRQHDCGSDDDADGGCTTGGDTYAWN